MVYARLVRLIAIVLVCGCAAPFGEARPGVISKAGGASLSFCGSTKVTAQRVLDNMEPPSSLPTEVGGSGGIEPPEQARFCVKLENRGSQTIRVDRSYLALKCPREKQPWIPDSDDRDVIVHGGETKQLYVSFQYSPMSAGEDVSLLFDGAVAAEGRPLKIAPLPLRRK
jgi:hypothetical protein